MNSSPPPTSRRSVAGVLGLNVVLVVALAIVSLPRLSAATATWRSHYTLTAGELPDHKGSVVWLVDTIQQEMLVLGYDAEEGRVIRIGHRNLAVDATGAKDAR